MVSEECYSYFVTLAKHSISVTAATSKNYTGYKARAVPNFTIFHLSDSTAQRPRWCFFVRKFCYFTVPLLEDNFTLFKLHRYKFHLSK